MRFAEDAQGKPVRIASAGDNYPLRGSKGTLFEGGVHGTAFLSGGFLPAACRGSVYGGLTAHVDLTATMLAVAGVNVSQVRPRIDGIDHCVIQDRSVAPALRPWRRRHARLSS